MSLNPFENVTFDNSYARDLKGAYIAQNGDEAPEPTVLKVNQRVAGMLGLNFEGLQTLKASHIFTGGQIPSGAEPLAMAYAGHQFGSFTSQLGDGRALLIGEVVTSNQERFDIQLKGSGRTPFSRAGDGKAALGPVLREYLISEAMFALGVPTTRALAASLTGEDIWRQDGMKKGAVLTRVAASHIRVGSFEFFAAHREHDLLKKLADYTITRHYPEALHSSQPYIAFFKKVRYAQAQLIAKWVSLGFVHGVMNTDNMTISGETIDYGPCAFIDQYNPKAVFSSIDEGGRYAYGQQPIMAQWNLSRFAEALIPLINLENPKEAAHLLMQEIHAFPEVYQKAWLEEMCKKLGFEKREDGDLELINELHKIIEGQGVDFTNLFRSLSAVSLGKTDETLALFDRPNDAVHAWIERYKKRLEIEKRTVSERVEALNLINPIYIPRNHLLEDALAAAEMGDLEPFNLLLERVTSPYTENTEHKKYAQAAPSDRAPHRTFCGT